MNLLLCPANSNDSRLPVLQIASSSWATNGIEMPLFTNRSRLRAGGQEARRPRPRRTAVTSAAEGDTRSAPTNACGQEVIEGAKKVPYCCALRGAQTLVGPDHSAFRPGLLSSRQGPTKDMKWGRWNHARGGRARRHFGVIARPSSRSNRFETYLLNSSMPTHGARFRPRRDHPHPRWHLITTRSLQHPKRNDRAAGVHACVRRPLHVHIRKIPQQARGPRNVRWGENFEEPSASGLRRLAGG